MQHTFGPGFLEAITLNTTRTAERLTVTATGTAPFDCGRTTHLVPIDQSRTYDVTDGGWDTLSAIEADEHQDAAVAADVAWDLVNDVAEGWNCECA